MMRAFRNPRSTVRVGAAVLLLFAASSALADEEFVLVPAPGNVAVDGKSDDWDLSGAYGPVSFDGEFLDRYDVTFYGMYDDDNLYLFFHAHDATPLVNRGIVEEGNYWSGDSIEVRFSIDPNDGVPPPQQSQNIRHLGIWFNSERQKPQSFIKATMKYIDWPETGMQVVFRNWPQNDGWDCEVALPWNTLSKEVRPKAGEHIAWCMAVLFGNEAGTGFWRKANVLAGDINYQSTASWYRPGAFLSPKGNVAPNPKTRTQPATVVTAPPVAHVVYTLPRAAKVSLAIYRPDGQLVRSLLCYNEQQAGENRIPWDGYDDDGNPLAPGQYSWKLAYGDGVRATYIMGTLNGGDPKYPTADGRGSWGGIWGNVIDTAADKTGVYLLWVMEEGQGALVKISPDGNVIWKQHIPQALASAQSALATNGEYVIMASARGLWRAKADSGDYAPFTPENAFIHLELPPEWQALKPEQKLEQVPELRRLPSLAGLHLTGIAIDGNRIFVSNVLDNAVDVYDMTTAARAGRIPVPRPFGLEVDRGTLYAVSGKSVLRFDAATLKPEGTAIAAGLAEPYGIAIDRWGRFWITDLAGSQQVKQFSPDGKLLAAFGKEGGRPITGGKFVKEDFLYPTGICVEPTTGQVFLGEDVSPKRVVALDSSGRFVRDWLGPYYCGQAVFAADPRHDPIQLYAAPSDGSMIRINVNLKQGTSELDAVWPERSFKGPDGKPIVNINANRMGVAYRNGKTFIAVCWGVPGIYRVEGYDLKPAAFLFMSGVDPLEPYGVYRKADGYRAFTWHDANDNGLVDMDEIQAYKEFPPFYAPYWGPTVYEDLAIVSSSQAGISRLAPVGFDPAGNPIYDLAKAQPLVTGLPYPATDPIGQVDKDGNIYYNRWSYAKPGEQPKGLDWAARLTDTGFAKLDPTGKPLWKVLRKAESFRKPWEAYAINQIAPPTHGCIFGDDCTGGQTYVVDTDGLLLDCLMEETPRGPTPSPYTLYVEHFCSYFFTDPRDGQLYMLTGADDVRFFRITGIDSYRRLQGTVAFNEQPKPRVTATLAAAASARAVRFAAPPAIDGDLAEWRNAPRHEFGVDNPGSDMSVVFQIAYDAANLYAAFHVVDSSPMVNSGTVTDSLFKYGDTLDLYLACDPKADPARKEPVPGDVHLLLTKCQGKPIVMAYRARVPGSKNPATFVSAVGKCIIDVVEPLAQAKLAFKTDFGGKGYSAELAVPLAALAPLKPSPNLTIGFDAAVNFSDAAGQINAAKAYWTRREAMVRDIPTEATFFQNKWGTLEFAP